MACKHKEEVLELLKNEEQNEELMEHIENCPECMALIEGYLERSKEVTQYMAEEIPPCDDSFFTRLIKKYHRGLSRIIVFTIVGFIMGWVSIEYISDGFIVTKIITAIPYKISEIIYNVLYEPPFLYQREFNAFFPQAGIISFFAERITPVWIGGALYGSLGYWSGDRKIFTFKKYIRFASIWLGIILFWIGSMFVANEVCLQKNSRLEGINGFFLNAESHGSGYYEGDSKIYPIIKEAFGPVENLVILDEEEVKRSESETRVEIYMGMGRVNITVVNWEEKYMILDNGKVLAITDEFAQLVEDYYYSKGIFIRE